MKVKPSDEYEIRTPECDLLICTMKVDDEGIDLISRQGKKTDHIRFEDFECRIYEYYKLAVKSKK